MTRSTTAAAAALVALALSGAAEAQSTNRFQLLGTRIVLDCHIQQFKEMVVTNYSTSAIAAGTTINFDATRYGSNQHYTGSFKSPALGVGASVHRGVEQSSSCTAWYNRSLLNSNPQNYQLNAQ